ncbi:protein FAR1-RELATED SEQUENCE 6-like [Arachis ipaensis]|uniref:protein FAR1-RELATED SEQUENCE 6-like n=1 Tax=Arachis ipaensis TaxID=130454 RepID=UPI0007AF5F1E|nr:protein FAR1-RELATED SEQUENCE 6-like [Arachis ipaensis]
MGGKTPKGILTDQCTSIQRAIELCIWHIMKKIPRKLNGYKGHNEIEQEMSHVVWNSYTKEAFDRNWIDFLRKYSLGGNKWLSAIEAQFQHVCTHEKFREVQAQFRVSRDVKFRCLLFESRGILCYHSLSILSFERIDNVAPKYILERWSKNIKRRHTHIKSSQDEPLLEPRSKRFDKLVFRSHNICEIASESEELTVILHRAFAKVMAEMEEYQGRSKGKSLLTHEEATF